VGAKWTALKPPCSVRHIIGSPRLSLEAELCALMDSRDADHTATTERWQLWQLQNVQDAVREVAFQEAAAKDLEVAYRLQLDEIMMEVDSDALCSMFEEDLEDCKLRRAALQVQVSLEELHARNLGLTLTDCCNRWQYSRPKQLCRLKGLRINDSSTGS